MNEKESFRKRIFDGYNSLVEEYKIDFAIKKEEIEYLTDLKKAINMNKTLLVDEKKYLILKIDSILETYYNSDNNRKIVYEILSEINKESVSLNKLNNLCNWIDLNKIEEFNYDDIKIIDSIIEAFNNDSHLRYKLNTLDGYNDIKLKILKKLSVLLKSTSEENKIRYDIEKHNIVLTNRFGGRIAKSVKIKFKEEEILEGKRIITLKNYNYPNINKAFSISDIDGVYVFEVFLPDVPTFLVNNRKLAEIAYQRSATFYLRKEDGSIYNIEMLPIYLSHKSLSLNKDKTKNVITFTFVVNRRGEILSETVCRNRIRVNYEVLSREADAIISKDINMGLIDIDINALNGLRTAMGYKSDLTSVPSKFVNDYVKRKNDIVIYKDKDIYSTNGTLVHATSPITDFASNINLGLVLYNNGLLDLGEDASLLEDNIDEVINHLNYMERVKNYVYRNSNEFLKYIKREDN